MRERATLLGGTFTAGRDGRDGPLWTVYAVLPLTEGGRAIRVLVAEDQSAVRAGLVLILRSAPDIEGSGRRRTASGRCGRPGSCGPTWC